MLLLTAAYAHSFNNAFHFDDSHVVENNLYIRNLKNIPLFFTDPRTSSSLPRNSTYRPLVTLSLALDYARAGGLEPFQYHVSQFVLLVVLGTMLVFFYRRVMDACRPSRWNLFLALFSATLFSVHTVNTETMNLMHARSEILSAIGLIAGFLVYDSAPWARRSLLYILPIAVGALAKVPDVIFAPLLFARTFLDPGAESVDPRSDLGRRARQAAAAATPAAIAGALIYWFVERAMTAPDVTYGGGDPLHYALTQPWVWLHYVRLFFLPVGLSADTDLTLVTSWYDTRVFAGLVVIALLAGVGWTYARRPHGWPVAFGLTWFALGLLPTSSLLPLAEPMNEHRVFLPYIGLVLAAVWIARLAVADRIARSSLGRRAGFAIPFAACGLVLVAHAAGVEARNEAWRTEETLWADVTKKSPGNGRGWMNYGLSLMRRGDYPGAKVCFERALTLTPGYSFLEVNMAILNGAMGDQKAAETHFLRALSLAPREPSSHAYYATWLVKQGRAREALPHLEEVLQLSPADEPSRILLLDLQTARGDDEAATRLARDVLAISPDNARAKARLNGTSPIQATPATYEGFLKKGIELGSAKSYVDSALAYRAALKLKPDSADALNNLGWTLAVLGFSREATPYLEEAVRIKPDFLLARNNLAWVRSVAH